MATSSVSYVESRIAATPHSQTSILTIPTANRNSSSTNGRKRVFDEISGLDEATYSRKHLATEGSVFFRPQTRFPRSFLWRVLDDRKLLEIQCVDLVQQRNQAKEERWPTFHIEFKDPIREKGIAFADAGQTDALEIYALTEANEIYTITLKRDLLMRGSAPTEFDGASCVKQYTSNPLTFRQPYRLFAVSNLELFISLSDGGFARLIRNAHENGSQWHDTFFNEGGLMGTLRGLNPLKRRQVVRYGGIELETNALAAMVKSPDGKHLWAVSLDHVLRAWDTSTWKIVHTMDLLNEDLSRHGQRDKKPFIMNAEVGTLLQIVQAPPSKSSRTLATTSSDEYSLAVYSPKDHQIKMYRVRQDPSSLSDGDSLWVEDMQPNARMIPPVDELMNANLWQLLQFHVNPGPNWENTDIWIRARSGALSRTFMLTFDPSNPDRGDVEIETVWKHQWTAVDQGFSTIEKLKEHSDYPGNADMFVDGPVTVSERWQAFLFYPGRFSQASLESALHIYRTGRGLTSTSNRGGPNQRVPFQERLTTAIAAKSILRSLPNKQPDYERYQADIQAQWQVYYSLLAQLHAKRQNVLEFAFDVDNQLPWSVCADFVGPIRFCSPLERHGLNLDIDTEQDTLKFSETNGAQETFIATRLMSVAHEFRQGLSATFQEKLRIAVQAEVQYFSGAAVAERSQRVQDIFDQSGLESEVTDEDFDALNAATESIGGLGSLDNNAPFVILDWLDKEGEIKGADDRRVLNRFGVKFTVATAQDTLELTRSVLMDLLALVVFMAGGLEENELDPGFQPDEIYEAIMARVRLNEVMLWLAGNTRTEITGVKSNAAANEAEPIWRSITLLEDIFIGDWHAVNVKNASMPELLTLWSKAWVAGPDLQQNWDGVTAHIMGSLLRHKNIALAVSFQQFLPSTPWSTYLLARLHAATGEYALASIGFRDAAQVLAERKNVETIDTANLLSAEEKNHFGHGLSRYYLHITSLFEHLKNYSYTAEFALLALQDPTIYDTDFNRSIAELDRKKSHVNSPAKDKMDNALEELRLLKVKELHEEILNRLFNAQVQTGHFRDAFDALTQIHDPPVRRSELRKLIETCVKQDDVPTLLSLPFDQHDDLAAVADRILLDLAKRGLASTSAAAHLPYHQILYAFRTRRSDFRGAAEVLFEWLERLRLGSNKYALQNPDDETLPDLYVLLINTLVCCGPDDAWLLAEAIPGLHSESQKRRLVTLADVRREYAVELDKRSEMMQGRFPLFGGDEMDVL